MIIQIAIRLPFDRFWFWFFYWPLKFIWKLPSYSSANRLEKCVYVICFFFLRLHCVPELLRERERERGMGRESSKKKKRIEWVSRKASLFVLQSEKTIESLIASFFNVDEECSEKRKKDREIGFQIYFIFFLILIFYSAIEI